MNYVEDIECLYPKNLSEAFALLANEKTRGRPVAGGTDLMVQWSSGVLPIPERVIDVFNLSELKDIRETAEAVEIGSGVTHMQLRSSPLVQKSLPALAASAATIGGIQIQSRGTMGGNVANASPAGDLAPALMITGGFVVMASAQGERKVELNRFYLGYRKIDLRPDELIVRFILPKLPAGHQEGFHKLGTRKAQAISKVMGAWRGQIEQGVVKSLAVSLGSIAPVPVRLLELEKWIVGKTVNAKLLAEAERRAAAEVNPIDDIRSTADYRRWVSGRLVRKFLESLSGRD